MKFLRFATALAAVLCFISSGCDTQDSAKKNGKQSSPDDVQSQDDGHDHGDEAHDDHGPKGGHLVKFDSDEYQAEWLHYNDNDIVRVVVYGPDGSTETAVKADSVCVKRIADGTVFELDPETPDENGATAVYSLDNKELSIAMNTGVNLEMRIGDKTFTTEIKPQKPHKH